MMELQVFNNNEFGEIRALSLENNSWFVGRDIASALGYSNPSKAVSTHCKHIRKETIDVSSQNGNAHKARKTQEVSLINEGDVYRLIVKSKLPSAQEFEEWVMDIVLPQIRQTGGYIPFSQGESNEEFLARALIVAQKTLDKKNKMIEEMTPRIAYLDKIQGYGNGITTKTIAADYGMSSIKFNQLLHDLHIQYKEGKMWHLYQEHKGNGYEIITYYKDKPHMKWTLKGAEWLYHILKDNGYIPIVEKDMKNN